MSALLLALVLFLGDPQATLERWREALELDLAAEVLGEAPRCTSGDGELARNGAALALHARALAQAGRPDEARALLEHAAVPEAERPRIEIALARLELDADRLAAAAARLTRIGPGKPVEPRWPDDAEATLLLGRAWHRAGESARARPVLERFLELAPLDPEAPGAWHMLAVEARARGDAERAQRCVEAERKSAQWQGYYRTRRLQIREHPREPLPRLGLAELWIAAGETARARAVLDELLALAPEFARGWLAYARLEQQAGRADEAAARHARYRALGGTEALLPPR